jgi:RNA polymerase sigma-70 factor (ECF subfamily)
MVSNKTKHYDRLFGRAFNILKDAHAAEDVVMMATARLEKQLEKEPDMTEDGQVAWLFIVVRNISLKALQKAKRYDVTDPINFSEEMGNSLSPYEVIDEREQKEVMQERAAEALKALPERQQKLLHLQYNEGLSYKQISERTGLSSGNIGYLINKSMNFLKQYVKQN